MGKPIYDNMSIQSNFSAQRSQNRVQPQSPGEREKWIDAIARNRWFNHKHIPKRRAGNWKNPLWGGDSKLEKSTFVGASTFWWVVRKWKDDSIMNPIAEAKQWAKSYHNHPTIRFQTISLPVLMDKIQLTYWRDFSLMQYFRHQQHDDHTGLHISYICISCILCINLYIQYTQLICIHLSHRE